MTCKPQTQTSKPKIRNRPVIQGLYHPDEAERFWNLLIRVVFARERKKDYNSKGDCEHA